MGLWHRRPRHPKLNALLISERVIREAETGVFSLIGIFDVLTTPTLPLTVPSLVVFAKMTDSRTDEDCPSGEGGKQ